MEKFVKENTSHVANGCELLRIRNLNDQVKLLKLISLAAWSALPDLIKEGKSAYKETVKEL